MTDSIAYIFVNSGLKDLVYKAYEDKANRVEELYKEILNFDQVKVFKDLPKMEIIKKLDVL